MSMYSAPGLALANTPSSPPVHVLDVRRVGHHRDHHVGVADRIGHVVGAPAAGLDQPLRPRSGLRL